VHQQPARRRDLYQRDLFLECDRLKNISAAGSARRDLGPFAGRVEGVQHIDWNILLHRRQHGCRMQNLGAEIRELSGLVEANHLDAPGIGTKAWIRCHHAVNVGPDFDALGIEAGAKNSRRKVRSTAANGGRDAGRIGTNKSAHHRHFARVEQRLNSFAQPLVGFVKLRNGASIAAVGEQALARIHVRTGQSAGDESRSHDLARKHFAERGNKVVGTRSNLSHRAYTS